MLFISYVCACHFLAFQVIHFPGARSNPLSSAPSEPPTNSKNMIRLIFQLIFSHVNQPQCSAYDGLQMIDIFKSCQPLASWPSWLSWPSWPLSCLPWASPAPNHYEAEHKSLAEMIRHLRIVGPAGDPRVSIVSRAIQHQWAQIQLRPWSHLSWPLALVGACSSRSDANVTVSTKLLEALQAAGMAGCGPM